MSGQVTGDQAHGRPPAAAASPADAQLLASFGGHYGPFLWPLLIKRSNNPRNGLVSDRGWVPGLASHFFPHFISFYPFSLSF